MGAGLSAGYGIKTLNNVFKSMLPEFYCSIFSNEQSLGEVEFLKRQECWTDVCKKTGSLNQNDFDSLWSELILHNQKTAENLKKIYFWYFWNKMRLVSDKTDLHKFIGKVKNENAAIISFNYDVLLENIFNSNSNDRFMYNYGFEDFDGKITLIKPMGSVNLIVGKDTDYISYSNATVNLNRPLSKYCEMNAIRRIAKIDDCKNIYEFPDYFEVFELPNEDKTVFRPSIHGDDYLMNAATKHIDDLIWNNIFALIEKADEIFAIGYSFTYLPDKNLLDSKASPKIMEFIKNVIRKPVTIINPDEKISKILERNYSDTNIKQYDITFNEWIKKEV